MGFSYKYPRMLVTVDSLVFLKDEESTLINVLLIQRKNYPFKGHFALPGGFPEMGELLKDAAKRELFEETGLADIELYQLRAFDGINRDPRDRNISIVFYGFTTKDNSKLNAGDDAQSAEWFPIDNLPKLAFDHYEIINFARNKLNI